MAAKVNRLAEKRIYIAELDINLTSLKDQYQGHELVYKKEFGINGIPIQFAVWDSNFNLSLNDKSAKKNFYIIADKVPWIECEIKTLKITIGGYCYNWQKQFDCPKFFKVERSDSSCQEIQLQFIWKQLMMTRRYHIQGEKINRVLGTFIIQIEAGTQHLLKEKLMLEFFPSRNKHDSEDIQLVCDDDKKISFNKELLCKISDVFKTMFENPMTSESKSNSVQLKKISLDTIKAFKNIMTTDDVINSKDLSVELLVFADRYNIQPLVRICQQNSK